MSEPFAAALETDVLVIGGGLFGCATAYHLARFGIEALVVERAQLGAEASGATAGNLHLQLALSVYKTKSAQWLRDYARSLPFFVAGVELWKQLARELPRDVELRIIGGIMVADTEAQMQALRDKVALEQANGLDIEMVSGAEVRTLAPYVADGILGASYCPGEGMANALTAVIAFAEGAKSAGARILPLTEVTGLEVTAKGWQAQTNRGIIRCKRVVIATGYCSDRLAAMAGVALPLSHRVILINATEPAEPFVTHLLYHAELRLTLKQVVNGNVIIGGGWSGDTEAQFGRPAVLREGVQNNLWVARHVVPAVGRLNLIRSWSSHNLYTPDGNPVLGAVPGQPGLHMAVCNTYGFTLGPLCCLLVAEEIAGRRPSFDLAPFSIARFG